MKYISKIILLSIPLSLTSQSSIVGKSHVEDRARWEGVRERIEIAVERGELTREEADECVKELKSAYKRISVQIQPF